MPDFVRTPDIYHFVQLKENASLADFRQALRDGGVGIDNVYSTDYENNFLVVAGGAAQTVVAGQWVGFNFGRFEVLWDLDLSGAQGSPYAPISNDEAVIQRVISGIDSIGRGGEASERGHHESSGEGASSSDGSGHRHHSHWDHASHSWSES